jgi:hypothetical protein
MLQRPRIIWFGAGVGSGRASAAAAGQKKVPTSKHKSQEACRLDLIRSSMSRSGMRKDTTVDTQESRR